MISEHILVKFYLKIKVQFKFITVKLIFLNKWNKINKINLSTICSAKWEGLIKYGVESMMKLIN